ncbi:MAG: ComEA family DNA-binding protein [Candidatus Limnocylindrales bacterium]
MDDRPAPWRAFELAERTATTVEAGTTAETATTAPSGIPIGWLVGGAALAIVLAIAAVVLLTTAPHGSVELASGAFPSIEASPAPGSAGPGLVVEVSGAVAHPGVVHLAAGARVADAIAAAGGYSPRVDAARADRELNLARIVADGDEIRVPSRDDPPHVGSGAGAAPAPAATGGSRGTLPIDLNSASAEQLDTLPGIGPVTAAKIVAARDTARFTSVDDLRTRKLVGSATLDKLRPLVVVH